MKRHIRAGIAYLALALVLGPTALAQRKRIDNQKRTILSGSRSPRIEGLVSDGPVEDSMRVSGITFRFRPSEEQSRELERLLEDQQDPSSPLYHAWLTPEEYSERFGLSAGEYTRVKDWVVSQGFQVSYEAKSRSFLSFSGTASQVRKTFATELHYYHVAGKRHFANTREVEVPSELEAMVYGIQGLDDFSIECAGKGTTRNATGRDGRHALTPGDLAVIYNLNPLYKKGITGAGQKILIVGQSGINVADVRQFRDYMGMPQGDPKILLMPGVKDPGYNDALEEALMDIQIAGGAAPGASILYLYGPNVVLATQYGIDQNLAPIVSYSWGVCEKKAWAELGWYRNLAQQAAAQGITWVASSGDAGAAGCESQLRDRAGVSGVAVNLPASVPEVTGVGGTEFAEGNNGNYWSPTNAEDGTSAQSYIPERAWNDTGAGTLLAATGGGVSAGYPRPTWQIGQGVPADNARHVPDVAFPASAEHDPYLVVMTGGIVETGGTSAGTPFFAGVLALLNQYVVKNGVQAKPGLGNINPRLYQLAQTSRGIFHDITAGNNVVPCKAGTAGCNSGQYGYNAGAGYDHSTGLGSMDITNLFESWASKPNQNVSSNVVVAVEPTPVYKQDPDEDGFQWYYTVRVSETAGATAKITSFSMDEYDLSSYIGDWFGTSTLAAKGSLSVALRSRDLDVPSDHVFAFSGTDNNGQRWSKQVTVRFLGEKSGAAMSLTSNPTAVVKIGKGDPNCSADHPFYQQLILRELNGVGVSLNKFLAGGYDYTGQIAGWFGSTRLPALGTLQAGLCWALERTPTTLSYEIDGVDETGQSVQATLEVAFRSFDDKSGLVADEVRLSSVVTAEAALTTPPSVDDVVVVSPMRSKPEPANRRSK